MKILRSTLFWALFFGTLFLLSLDFWSWNEAISLGWMNFPSWLGYFLVLQGCLVLGLAVFAIYKWDRK